MKIILALIVSVLFTIATTHAQEVGKNLGSVYLAIDSKLPKDFKHEDDQVSISSKGESMSVINFEIRNNTSSAISFLWADSYFVISERTSPFTDAGKATSAAFGLSTTESNSVNPPAKIGSNANILAKVGSATGLLFDFRAVNKYFKDNGKMPQDRAVFVFDIGGEKVEKVIPMQVYTSKIRKSMK